jgi:GNAT superfamily N-acetyltransferase
MTEVHLRRLSRWQADQQRDAVADLYAKAYRGAAGAEYHDRQAFLDRFEQDVQRPDFDMVVADAAGLVGCAYGFRIARTGAWWSGLRGELPEDIEELTASGRMFLLAELMVLPTHRRTGIAARLGERLLARLDADLIVAAVNRTGGETEDNAAAEVLRSWGWSKLGELDPRTARNGSGPGPVAREVWIRRPLR